MKRKREGNNMVKGPETSYLKKRNKKECHDSSMLENIFHNYSSLENDGCPEVIELSGSELSSPLNKTNISSKNISLKKNRGNSDTVNETTHLKKRKRKRKKHHACSTLENLLRDSSLIKERSLKGIESTSELTSQLPILMRVHKKNKGFKRSFEKNNSKLFVSDNMFLVSEKQRNMSITHVLNTNVNGIVEEVDFENYTSPYKKKKKLQKNSLLSNREIQTQEEINSESSMLSSNNKKKQRENCRNGTIHAESESSPSSQSPIWKRNINDELNNKNALSNSYKEKFETDLYSAESELSVKSVGTKRKEDEANSKSSPNKPEKNKLHKQTNNVTINNGCENSASSVLESSEEIEQSPDTNVFEETDDDLHKEQLPVKDVLIFIANKLGNRKEECDKRWYDAVQAEFEKNVLANQREVEVTIKHDIPPLHLIDCNVCTVPKKEEREKLVLLGMKQTPFSKSEDAIIMQNWEELCTDNGVPPSLLIVNVTKRIGGYKQIKKKIAQYLGKDLPDRALYQIYSRFLLLSCSKRGQFTDEEDYLILKTVSSNEREKYALLSTILNRSRNTIFRRYRHLLSLPIVNTGVYCKVRNKWNMSLATNVVKSLIKHSGESSIDAFKDKVISIDMWRQVENDVNINREKLRHFWMYKLHVQLFANTAVRQKEVQKKIVQWLHRKNYSTDTDIQWSRSIRLVAGSTSSFMCLQFRAVKYNFVYDQFKGLREFINAVYTQKDAFDGPSRYLKRYKVNDDFSLSVIREEEST